MSTVISSDVLETDDEPLIDVNVLKDLAKKALVDALNAVSGAKTLVLDPSLAGPLGLVTEVSLLKQHGVDKMFWLEPGPLISSVVNVVYLCRPLIRHIKIISDQLKRHRQESQNHKFTLMLVPRTSALVTRILEEEGVLGDVTISTYNLQFIPIAEDVISLENDGAFRELWIDGDETVIFNSAEALMTLEKLYGLFPRVVGKGDYAERLADLLTRKKTRKSDLPETMSSTSDKVDALIILDRRVDMITPLLTQLTYEGLIDECFGIQNSHVELPTSLVSPPTIPPVAAAAVTASTASTSILAKEKKKKYHLTTSSDPLFGDLRDVNFSSVGKKLNKVAHRLDNDYKAKLQDKTVPQLRDFVGKLGGLQREHQALRLHTGLSEMIAPQTRTEIFEKSLEIQQNLVASYDFAGQLTAIEDIIAQGADMQTALRLICLACITGGGIKNKALENLKREVLQSYGYEHLPILLSLAAAPLSILLPYTLPSNTPVSIIESKLPFAAVRKSLRLLIDDTTDALDEMENDISFVYSGYAPISIRLVQCVAQRSGVLSNPAEREGRREDVKPLAHAIVGWKGFEDTIAAIPGKSFDMFQSGSSFGISTQPQPIASLLRPTEAPTKTTIVFFLGGCTYTELAALRWVGRQNKGRKFLIATTGMISGNSLVDSIANLSKKS